VRRTKERNGADLANVSGFVIQTFLAMKKTVLDHIPEHIRKLNPYVPGNAIRQAERESGAAVIKLASNENPFGPSPLAREAIRRAAEKVNRYPDVDASELRAALASLHGLPQEQIFIADGSLGILDILARTLLAPGLNAVSSERSFISYPLVTRAAGARYVTAPMRRHTYHLDGILDAIDENTRVVYLANPNNPTGTMFDADASEAFLSRVPEDVLVVLDEAYYDFAQDFAAQRGIIYSRSLEQVRTCRPNLLVLRTFSKVHGLAGLRIGYGCGDPEFLKYLGRIRNAFSISAVAEAAALAALHDTVHIRRTVENNAAGARWLAERLTEMGVQPVPTSANFLYFEVDEDANAFAKRMQAEGVIVRSLVPWDIPNGIRVSVGSPEQNDEFVRVFKKVGRRDLVIG
jgi:histidinol-phosphate aminotransferase